MIPIDILAKHEPNRLLKEQVIKWRRHFHQYPELSFHEEQTSAYIVNVLESFGVYTIETGIAKHGVIATLKGGAGPVIGIRADMDALPIVEQNDVPHTSENKGVMHACGHDAHMAIVLGVAAVVADYYQKGQINGSIKFIFQPAEEDTDDWGKTGAPYFIESGVTEALDSILALHMCPWLETGAIQVNKGVSMANIDNFQLTILGKGGHGGYPHESKDPIWMLSFVLQGLYGLISRKLNPLEVGTISIGKVNAGETPNVIPSEVTVIGTIRSYSKTTRQQLIQEIEQVAQMTHSLGGDYRLEIEAGEPALDNDPAIIEQIKTVAKDYDPDMNVVEAPYGMGGEDFGHFTQQIPGAMFFLGCANKDEPIKPLHSNNFTIDEASLQIGVDLLVGTVLDLLKPEELSSY